MDLISGIFSQPENIMATYAAERFLIKLVDFGSACKITTDQAKVAEGIGPTEFFGTGPSVN